MTKKNSITKTFLIVITLFVLTGCNDNVWNEIRDNKGIARKTRLTEMVHQGRQYEFYYDKKGFVDYINTDAGYMYQVTYEKNKLYSASLVENNSVISENHNFKFDRKGNIVEFTYTWYMEGLPGGYNNVHTLTYDQNNRVTSISNDSGVQSFTYDNKDNVIQSQTDQSEITHTYDNKLNPLNRVPQLFFLVVEEPFLWEFILSKYNSVTRSESPTVNNPQGAHATYTNEYDAYFRLIKKYVVEVSDGFTFAY